MLEGHSDPDAGEDLHSGSKTQAEDCRGRITLTEKTPHLKTHSSGGPASEMQIVGD